MGFPYNELFLFGFTVLLGVADWGDCIAYRDTSILCMETEVSVEAVPSRESLILRVVWKIGS